MTTQQPDISASIAVTCPKCSEQFLYYQAPPMPEPSVELIASVILTLTLPDLVKLQELLANQGVQCQIAPGTVQSIQIENQY